MKVKVKTEFKDKYTEQIHHAGEELEMSIDRINEVLKVGNFIELIAEPTEQEETADQTQDTEDNQDETADAREQVEEAPKQTTRRKRSK